MNQNHHVTNEIPFVIKLHDWLANCEWVRREELIGLREGSSVCVHCYCYKGGLFLLWPMSWLSACPKNQLEMSFASRCLYSPPESEARKVRPGLSWRGRGHENPTPGPEEHSVNTECKPGRWRICGREIEKEKERGLLSCVPVNECWGMCVVSQGYIPTDRTIRSDWCDWRASKWRKPCSAGMETED